MEGAFAGKGFRKPSGGLPERRDPRLAGRKGRKGRRVRSLTREGRKADERRAKRKRLVRRGKSAKAALGRPSAFLSAPVAAPFHARTVPNRAIVSSVKSSFHPHKAMRSSFVPSDTSIILPLIRFSSPPPPTALPVASLRGKRIGRRLTYSITTFPALRIRYGYLAYI